MPSPSAKCRRFGNLQYGPTPRRSQFAGDFGAGRPSSIADCTRSLAEGEELGSNLLRVAQRSPAKWRLKPSVYVGPSGHVDVLMQITAPHQPPGDLGGLQRRALGRRMSSEIARDRDEDVSA